jgi:hypothetical protein
MPDERQGSSNSPAHREPSPRAGADAAITNATITTPYERALSNRDLREFRATDVNSLIEQAAIDMAKRGIVDEIGALRIVLARLVTEEDDLQTLTKHVTQVVSVALAAAKTRRLIDGDPFAAIPKVVALIMDDVEEARKAGLAERRSNDNPN